MLKCLIKTAMAKEKDQDGERSRWVTAVTRGFKCEVGPK